ncbi:MAG TPA: PfkB family carbohydrate kinase [Candidatus Eisenbacteria bacterium]|nr:PfkB family carbohydrate kinase [Candidatus Eisenbacteria bacterium]
MDFVAIGHVTLDQTPRGTRPGGAAYYTAMTAHRLGLRVGLLTSFGPDFPREAVPADIEVVNVPAERTTTFRIGQTRPGPGGRTRELAVLARAADLEADALPEAWRDATLGALAPVTGEVDPGFAAAFPETSLVALPQGWMRQRGKGGILAPQPWEDADLVLPRVQALVVSHEDVEPFEKDAVEWFQQVPVGAVTRGSDGAILFVNGDRYGVEPDVAVEKDATGAGDVFAAALLVSYNRDGNAWDAAAVAACCAAASVEADGAAGIPDRERLEARLAAYRRRHGI